MKTTVYFSSLIMGSFLLSISLNSCYSPIGNAIIEGEDVALEKVYYEISPYTTEGDNFYITTGNITRANVDPIDINCKYLVAEVYDLDSIADGDYIPEVIELSTDAGDEISSLGLYLNRGKSYKLSIIVSDKELNVSDNGHVYMPSVSIKTYWGITQIDVTESSPSINTADFVLSRPIGRVTVQVSDCCPAELLDYRFYYSHYCNSINMLTGCGIPNSSQHIVGENGSSTFQTANRIISAYSFVDTSVETIAVGTTNFYNAGSITFTATVHGKTDYLTNMTKSNIPILQNRQTVIRGNFFGSDTSLSLQVNDEWDTPVTINW